MLPKKHRLPKERFPVVHKKGKRVLSDHLKCYLTIGMSNVSRFGYSIPIRIQKSAVKRNKMKRLLREACTQTIPSLRKPVDCFIIPITDVSSMQLTLLIKEIRGLLLSSV